MDERQTAYFKINDTFGTSNMVAILVPTGDYEAEAKILAELETCEGVKSSMGLANTELTDGIMLTDAMNPRELSEALDIDYDLVEMLYTLYAMEDGQIGKLVSMDTYRVPVFDLLCYVKTVIDDSGMELEGEMGEMLSMLSMLDMAKEQLQTESYSRMVVYLDLPEEGEQTYAFLEQIHTIADKYYDQPVYAIGNSTSCRDLGATFARDNLLITILSIVFVVAVLLFTFKSAGLPVLLVLVIQGSIWINFSFPVFLEQPLYFLGYLIVSAIQMGANIDYAIVISSHYQEKKAYMPHKEAIVHALNAAFPTVFTSGIMMSSAGLLIGNMSAQPVIAIMGTCLGRGTIISIVLVLFVLPSILVLGDSIIERTRFKMKAIELPVRQASGTIRVSGRLRGYVSGYVDGTFSGSLKGQMNATVSTETAIEVQEETPEGGAKNA
jgi:predicted RND superfamily exporter protein